MANGNTAVQIRRVNKFIDQLIVKASKIKDASVREECAFHATLTADKAKKLMSALSASNLFNKLSKHNHAPAKKTGKKK